MEKIWLEYKVAVSWQCSICLCNLHMYTLVDACIYICTCIYVYKGFNTLSGIRLYKLEPITAWIRQPKWDFQLTVDILVRIGENMIIKHVGREIKEVNSTTSTLITTIW